MLGDNKNHYIAEWADRRDMRQIDIVKALEASRTPVDKSTVSRWFAGTLPEKAHLEALKGIFGLDELASLFRHPDDDWLTRFLRSRDADERHRIRLMLEAAFPDSKAS